MFKIDNCDSIINHIDFNNGKYAKAYKSIINLKNGKEVVSTIEPNKIFEKIKNESPEFHIKFLMTYAKFRNPKKVN